jgi:hypothetical protein
MRLGSWHVLPCDLPFMLRDVDRSCHAVLVLGKVMLVTPCFRLGRCDLPFCVLLLALKVPLRFRSQLHELRICVALHANI